MAASLSTSLPAWLTLVLILGLLRMRLPWQNILSAAVWTGVGGVLVDWLLFPAAAERSPALPAWPIVILGSRWLARRLLEKPRAHSACFGWEVLALATFGTSLGWLGWIGLQNPSAFPWPLWLGRSVASLCLLVALTPWMLDKRWAGGPPGAPVK